MLLTGTTLCGSDFSPGQVGLSKTPSHEKKSQVIKHKKGHRRGLIGAKLSSYASILRLVVRSPLYYLKA